MMNLKWNESNLPLKWCAKRCALYASSFAEPVSGQRCRLNGPTAPRSQGVILRAKTPVSASRTTVLLTGLILSTHTYAIAGTESPNGGVASATYRSVTHFPEGVETTVRQPEVHRAAPAVNGSLSHSAIATSKQVTEWYAGLGRHEKASGVEILLIGCYIALRICSKRRKQAFQNEPIQKSSGLPDDAREGLFPHQSGTT
jgi:hypothetical protein